MAQRKRRYCLTLNNPTDEELEHIKDLESSNLKRGIFCLEVGESGTPHIQGFIHMKNAMTFSAVKKMLGTQRVHIEAAKGTDYEAWTYCMKDVEGKGASIVCMRGDEPSIEGELSDWEKIAQMVKDGASNLEIIAKYPSIAIRCQSALEKYRLEWDRQNAGWRDLEVTFITGPTGCGKTRTVMETFGYNNVFRVQTYGHTGMFDNYNGQDVLVFEEFRGKVPIEQMLNFLDGYPCELPARYANKLAKFTKVFMLTNIQFDEMYAKIQRNHPETYDAFKRRVHNVVSMWDN